MLDGTKEIVMKHLNHKIGWGKNLDERYDKTTDDAAKKRLEHCSDRNDAYIFGAETVLEDMGYWLEKDDDGNITDICSVMIRQYRVRYRNDRFTNAIICNDGNEVQTVIDRLKATSLRNPEYKFEGIDDRVIYPNGDTGEWNKIFDF